MRNVILMVLVCLSSVSFATDKKESRKPANVAAGDYVCSQYNGGTGPFTFDSYNGDSITTAREGMNKTCDRNKPFQVIKMDGASFGFCCIKKQD